MKLLIVAIGVVLCNVLAAVSAKYTVEIYVVVDKQVEKLYIDKGADPSRVAQTIEGDMKFVMAQVNKLYGRLKQSAGMDVEIKVRKLDILKNDIVTSARNGRTTNRGAIEDFQKFLKDNNKYQELKYDMAFLCTGYQLGNVKGAGYAVSDRVCDEKVSTLVMQYEGRSSNIFIAAHEIGHMLGLDHDVTTGCTGYIMATTVFPGNEHKFDFSRCSIQQLQRNLNDKDCLQDTNPQSYTPDSKPTADFLDMNTMCKRGGRNHICTAAHFYDGKAPKGDAICKFVYCGTTDRSTTCYQMHATEGMVCAAGKRCEFGKCKQAPSDFPVTSNVDDDCLFGDQLLMKKRMTCKAYFSGGSKDNDCKSQWTASQCCKTCNEILGGGGGGGGGRRTTPPGTKVTKPNKGGSCTNKNSNCDSWAKRGECQINPRYMRDYCYKACNPSECGVSFQKTTTKPRTTARSGCSNKRGDGTCNTWSLGGYCQTNQNVREELCYKTCNPQKCGG